MNANRQRKYRVVKPAVYARKQYRKPQPAAVAASAPVISGMGAYRRKRRPAARQMAAAPQSDQSVGYKIGGFLGDLAQKGIKMLTGFGDYAAVNIQPRMNTLMNEMTDVGPPLIVNSKTNSVIVRHREFLGDIVTGAAGTFNLQSFSINPGLASTFPWLSNLAASYQEYRPLGMIFEFKSTSADALNSTNTALGTVIMATDYDATDSISAVFQNKQAMENHEFASSARQSCSILHPIECAPNKNPLGIYHVRQGAEPANADLRLTDIGTFAIATAGQQGASVTIGELWVSYEIEFLKPQMINGIGLNIQSYKAYNATGVSTSAYFGTLANLVVRSGSIFQPTIGLSTVTFPPLLSQGSYLVIVKWLGSSTASVNLPTVNPTNCSLPLMWDNGVNGNFGTLTSTTTVCIIGFVVKITAAGASFQFAGGTLPSSCDVDLVITQWNGGIST